MRNKRLTIRQVKNLNPGTKVADCCQVGPSIFRTVWTVYIEGRHKKLYRDTGTMIMRQRIEDIEGHWYELYRT